MLEAYICRCSVQVKLGWEINCSYIFIYTLISNKSMIFRSFVLLLFSHSLPKAKIKRITFCDCK